MEIDFYTYKSFLSTSVNINDPREESFALKMWKSGNINDPVQEYFVVKMQKKNKETLVQGTGHSVSAQKVGLIETDFRTYNSVSGSSGNINHPVRIFFAYLNVIY